MEVRLLCFFFFQAEDGIRDIGVTGVQTCALPIWATLMPLPPGIDVCCVVRWRRPGWKLGTASVLSIAALSVTVMITPPRRSEERRVGKECRSRWSPYH